MNFPTLAGSAPFLVVVVVVVVVVVDSMGEWFHKTQ
jgi:hypothetical protein